MNWTDRHIMAATAAAAIAWGCAAPVHAQSRFRPYVGGSIGAFSVDADEVDGRSVAPAILGGITVSRFVDVEVEATFPTGRFRRTHTGPGTSFAPSGASREEIERLAVITHVEWSREVALNINAVAIIHPAATGRVVPALVAGISNQWARNTTERTPISIPPGVDPQHPRVQPETERGTRNIGAPTVGAQLSIRVTPHFYVVPDLRYDYGSIGDEINNALRTSVRGIWRF